MVERTLHFDKRYLYKTQVSTIFILETLEIFSLKPGTNQFHLTLLLLKHQDKKKLQIV